MASLKTHVIITVVLASLTCLTMARELRPNDHLAPESAPSSNSSAYATLPADARNLGLSPSAYKQEDCGQGGNPGYGGSGGGMPYGGAGSGGGMSYGGAGSGGGMQYSGAGAGSDGGTKHSAAGSGPSFVHPVALSALLLVAGLIYF